MSSDAAIERPQAGSVWRADRMDHQSSVGFPTGFARLDAELPTRGWPQAGLVEIQGIEPAGSEWQLLTPCLRRRVAEVGAGPVLCVNPPHEPSGAACLQAGIPIDHLLLVRTVTFPDAAWAAEQAIHLASPAAMLWWASVSDSISTLTMLRRVHLASLSKPTPVFLVTSNTHATRLSPAILRLSIKRISTKLAITVFKRRGPIMEHAIEVELPMFAGHMPIKWRAHTFHAKPFKSARNRDHTAEPTPLRAGIPAKQPVATDHALACGPST